MVILLLIFLLNNPHKMHKKLIFLFFILCFIPNSIIAQKLELTGSFILFKEAKTKEPILIINDSLLYKGVKPIKIPFKRTKYPDKLQEYISINIKDKTYLVHGGCGPVLEFRNDSIVRINDSYLHHNQYGAVHFVYNNEIYFFGGYGLFTCKNILTKYVFKTKDWIQVQTRGEKAQEPRTGAYSFLKGDDLYVFGGGNKDENNIPNDKLLDNKVWRLNLPTMHWHCMGTYNQQLFKKEHEFTGHDSKKTYFMGSHFSEIDYYTNKIYRYDCNYFPTVLDSYLEGKTIIGVFGIGGKIFYHTGDISEFRGKLKSTSVFITPLEVDKSYLAKIAVSLFLLIVLLFLFRKQLKDIVKPFKGIIYNQRRNVFLFKGKPIMDFDENDKKILFYLLENNNRYLSLNEMNQLFENNEVVETIWATIKRREQALSGLLTKVSKITGMPEKELVIERKNSFDKRIKDIMFFPNLLKRQ